MEFWALQCLRQVHDEWPWLSLEGVSVTVEKYTCQIYLSIFAMVNIIGTGGGGKAGGKGEGG